MSMAKGKLKIVDREAWGKVPAHVRKVIENNPDVGGQALVTLIENAVKNDTKEIQDNVLGHVIKALYG